MNNKTIKTNIQHAREMASLSQEEMADKLGISRQSYMRIESGETTLIHKQLQEIADQCGISIGKLMFGYEPDKKRPVERVQRELKEATSKLVYTERERDAYKAKSDDDEKMIQSLKDHIDMLQTIVRSHFSVSEK